MKNPYGLKNGCLVSVNDVPRGLECGCICPACKQRLQAHKGAVRNQYFAHYRGSDCGYGYETALHLLAKDILAEEKRLLLPDLRVHSDLDIAIPGTCLESKVIVPPWKRICFEGVLLEERLGRIKPDLIMKKGQRELLVEIRVTHGIDDQKRAWLYEHGLSTIEFDLSKTNRFVGRQALRRVLIETYGKRGLGRSTWVYHPLRETTEAELTDAYKRKNMLV